MKKFAVVLLVALLAINSQASEVCGKIELGNAGCDVDICGFYIKSQNDNGNVFKVIISSINGKGIFRESDLAPYTLGDILNIGTACVDTKNIYVENELRGYTDLINLVKLK